jgi:hypothetical protein
MAAGEAFSGKIRINARRRHADALEPLRSRSFRRLRCSCTLVRNAPCCSRESHRRLQPPSASVCRRQRCGREDGFVPIAGLPYDAIVQGLVAQVTVPP